MTKKKEEEEKEIHQVTLALAHLPEDLQSGRLKIRDGTFPQVSSSRWFEAKVFVFNADCETSWICLGMWIGAW